MRRVVLLGALALSTVLPISTMSVLEPASATAEPTVERSVRFSFRDVDLTHGRQILLLWVTGRAKQRLALGDMVMMGTTPTPSGGTVRVETAYPNGYVMGYRPIRKVSGGPRHGMWRVRIPLDRHLPADTYHFYLEWSVGGVDVESALKKTLTVDNTHSDTHPPVMLALQRPAAGASVPHKPWPTVSMHLRDRGAGVGLVWVCYYDLAGDPRAPGALQCDAARRRAGTKHDGIWTTRLTHLRKLDPGDVVLRITTYDRVMLECDWVPADQLADDGFPARVIPGGRGHINLTD